MILFLSLPGLSPVASRELGDIFPINEFPSFGGTISDPWTSPHSLWSLLRVSCSSLEIVSDFSFIPSSASSGLSHIPSYTISSTFHWPKDFFPQFQSPWEGVEGSAPVQGVLSHPFFSRNSPLWDILSSSTDPDEIGAAISALELQFLSLNLQGFLRELRILGIIGLQTKKIKD